MKYLIILLLLCVLQTAHAQNQSDTVTSLVETIFDEDQKVFTKCEVPPVYLQGHDQLLQYINEGINKEALIANGTPKGTYEFMVRFIVRKNGSAYNFVAETNTTTGVADAVLATLKKVPEWKPGQQNKHIVYAYYRFKVVVVI